MSSGEHNPEPPPERIASSGVPLRRTSIWVEEEMWAVAQQEADKLGITLSELVRQALAMRLAWAAAIHAAQKAGPLTIEEITDRILGPPEKPDV